jgi:hypothetical protein
MQILLFYIILMGVTNNPHLFIPTNCPQTVQIWSNAPERSSWLQRASSAIPAWFQRDSSALAGQGALPASVLPSLYIYFNKSLYFNIKSLYLNLKFLYLIDKVFISGQTTEREFRKCQVFIFEYQVFIFYRQNIYIWNSCLYTWMSVCILNFKPLYFNIKSSYLNMKSLY